MRSSADSMGLSALAGLAAAGRPGAEAACAAAAGVRVCSPWALPPVSRGPFDVPGASFAPSASRDVAADRRLLRESASGARFVVEAPRSVLAGPCPAGKPTADISGDAGWLNAPALETPGNEPDPLPCAEVASRFSTDRDASSGSGPASPPEGEPARAVARCSRAPSVSVAVTVCRSGSSIAASAGSARVDGAALGASLLRPPSASPRSAIAPTSSFNRSAGASGAEDRAMSSGAFRSMAAAGDSFGCSGAPSSLACGSLWPAPGPGGPVQISALATSSWRPGSCPGSPAWPASPAAPGCGSASAERFGAAACSARDQD